MDLENEKLIFKRRPYNNINKTEHNTFQSELKSLIKKLELLQDREILENRGHWKNLTSFPADSGKFLVVLVPGEVRT